MVEPAEGKLDDRIDWLGSAPFLVLHAAVASVFFVTCNWGLVALCIGLYAVRMFGVVGGYHRYFSHRSYKMGRIPQFVMAWVAQSSAQKGVLWWAAYHRHHHKYSDQPEDIHSPTRRGFWWAHIGWIMSRAYQETRFDLIPDFAKYPELRWLNRHHWVPPASLAVALFLVGGWPALVWGFVVSTVLLWHGTFVINSITHCWGRRRYVTTDTSRNSFILSVVTLGEGWHNNHHCYQASANSGFFWWEFDPTYYVLKALSWLGIVSNLKRPPLQRLEAQRIDGATRTDPMFELIKSIKQARHRVPS